MLLADANQRHLTQQGFGAIIAMKSPQRRFAAQGKEKPCH
jgi:hypothetical protein